MTPPKLTMTLYSIADSSEHFRAVFHLAGFCEINRKMRKNYNAIGFSETSHFHSRRQPVANIPRHRPTYVRTFSIYKWIQCHLHRFYLLNCVREIARVGQIKCRHLAYALIDCAAAMIDVCAFMGPVGVYVQPTTSCLYRCYSPESVLVGCFLNCFAHPLCGSFSFISTPSLGLSHAIYTLRILCMPLRVCVCVRVLVGRAWAPPVDAMRLRAKRQ